MTTVADLERRRPSFGLRHRLALSREIANLEQIDVANALGVARATISNYERGFTQPKRAMIMAWALATGVDVHWLMTGQEETPAPDGPGGGYASHLGDSNPRPIHYMRWGTSQRHAA